MGAHITPHFQWHEFESRGQPVPDEFRPNVRALCVEGEVIRDYFGAPVTVICGHRSWMHNEDCYKDERAAGDMRSGRKSRHLTARAFDIRVRGYTPQQVYNGILELIAAGKLRDGGVGLYGTFVHYDIGRAGRRW